MRQAERPLRRRGAEGRPRRPARASLSCDRARLVDARQRSSPRRLALGSRRRIGGGRAAERARAAGPWRSPAPDRCRDSEGLPRSPRAVGFRPPPHPGAGRSAGQQAPDVFSWIDAFQIGRDGALHPLAEVGHLRWRRRQRDAELPGLADVMAQHQLCHPGRPRIDAAPGVEQPALLRSPERDILLIGCCRPPCRAASSIGALGVDRDRPGSSGSRTRSQRGRFPARRRAQMLEEGAAFRAPGAYAGDRLGDRLVDHVQRFDRTRRAASRAAPPDSCEPGARPPRSAAAAPARAMSCCVQSEALCSAPGQGSSGGSDGHPGPSASVRSAEDGSQA